VRSDFTFDFKAQLYRAAAALVGKANLRFVQLPESVRVGRMAPDDRQSWLKRVDGR
jgi:hypothetical protein